MKNNPILLLCGQAGSGKDTIAGMIQKQMPKTVTIAQAAPLKQLGRELFLFTKDQMYGPSELRNGPDKRFDKELAWELVFNELPVAGQRWLNEVGLDNKLSQLRTWLEDLKMSSLYLKKTLTPRQMLQTLGTEFGRKISPNVWPDIAFRKARQLLVSGEANLVIVTDGRFRNEILNAKTNNAMAILVTTPEHSDAVDKAGVKGHASEEELKNVPLYWFDEVFVNLKQFGLPFLEKRVEEFCHKNFAVNLE